MASAKSLGNPANEGHVAAAVMDGPTKESLLKEAQEMRWYARRVLRMGAHLTDAADQERLAGYAADLEDYAAKLERQARSMETEPLRAGCVKHD